MHKCVETINEYYTNLEYQNNRKEAQENISNLCKTLKFKDTDKLSHRFFHTASLIKNNLNFFLSVCEHVDVVNTIIDHFNYFGAIIEINDAYINNDTTINISIMLIICNMYQDHEMQLFLETAIIKESQMEGYNTYKELIMLHVDIILLEDSDLHAIMNCLKLNKSVANVLSKIWIQESIRQTFMWYFKKYFEYVRIEYVSIQTFQSKQDLLLTLSNISLCNVNTVNIVSIWSEDITAAKNLAESLKHDILCINTYMSFDPGVILSYMNVNLKSLDFSSNLYQMKEYTCTNPINSTTRQDMMFGLFYNGKWQTPIEKKYWMHNNILFANATCEDVVKCTISARDGFIIWSTMSNKSRRQILVNFANLLESESKFPFAYAIRNGINFLYICESIMTCSFENEKVEISQIYGPKGTVILKEGDATTLFVDLTINLAFGNSVIVICNPDSYILTQCCNMFKMCGIPPGLINVLSSENADFKYDIINGSASCEIFAGISLIRHMIVARQ